MKAFSPILDSSFMGNANGLGKDFYLNRIQVVEGHILGSTFDENSF